MRGQGVQLLTALLALIVPSLAGAQIVISHAWARPTAPAAEVGAVYFTVENRGSRPERLVALNSPAAAKVELHESRGVGGTMQMRELTILDCPAGVLLSAAPGGLHAMLLQLKHPLAAGTSFPLVFHFSGSGDVTVIVSVRNPNPSQ